MKTNHYHMLWSCARVRTRRDVMGTQWRAEVVTALCTEEYRSQQAAQKRKKIPSRGSKAPRGMERRKTVAHLLT